MKEIYIHAENYINDLYRSYDDVLDRIRVLNTIILSPESTFREVEQAKKERDSIIPIKRELDKEVNLADKYIASFVNSI